MGFPGRTQDTFCSFTPNHHWLIDLVDFSHYLNFERREGAILYSILSIAVTFLIYSYLPIFSVQKISFLYAYFVSTLAIGALNVPSIKSFLFDKPTSIGFFTIPTSRDCSSASYYLGKTDDAVIFAALSILAGYFLLKDVVTLGRDIGNTLFTNNSVQNKWKKYMLLYMLLWGEPFTIPVIFIPDRNVLNFRFAIEREWSDYLSTTKVKDFTIVTAVQAVIQYLSNVVQSLNQLWSRFSPGPLQVNVKTDTWLVMNPACSRRYSEVALCIKIVVAAAFIFSVLSMHPLFEPYYRYFYFARAHGGFRVVGPSERVRDRDDDQNDIRATAYRRKSKRI